MEPITILIYIAIVFSVIIGTLLSLVLFRLLRILTKADHVLDYIDHVRNLLERWEQLPFRLLQSLFEKFVK